MHANPLKRILARLQLMVLVVCLPQEAPAQSKGWKTFTDTARGYEFDYPPDYEIHSSASGGSLKHGNTTTEFYIEDWTRSVAGGRTQWVLPNFSIERGLVACMADGPDCSTSCELHNSEQVPNKYGVHVLALTRNEVNTCKPGVLLRLDPMYVIDLSGLGSHVLLIFDTLPNRRGVASDVLRLIVGTIRRVGR